jgi:hypothetical protein
MNEILIQSATLPPTPLAVCDLIRKATEKIKPYEHTLKVQMEHALWAGMYARTARLAPGQAITSVLIKLPTLLIVHGDCWVLSGDKWHALRGYNVIQASANRMQCYVTISETQITMLFPSNAKTVEEAEAEFTDEAHELLSRREVEACQA